MGRVVGMLVLLLSPGVLLAAPGVDAPFTTGLWRIAGDVTGRPVTMMCQLTASDRKLSGICTGEEDGFTTHKITGTVKAQKVQFYFQASFGGASITMVVSGTLNQDGSRMDGDLDVEPMAIGGLFQATREPNTGLRADTEAAPVAAPVAVQNEAAPASAAGAPADATGSWKIDGDVMGTPVTMTCVLTEAEHKLAGTCSGAGESRTPRALTGTATAKGVGWRFDDEYQGQPITFSMNATLAGDGRMNGTMTVAPFGVQGTFVAVRQPPLPN